MFKIKLLKIIFVFLVTLFFYKGTFAQILIQDNVETVKAKVVKILKQERKIIPGTDTSTNFQTIEVEIFEGANKGKIVTVENDYLNLSKNQRVYLTELTRGEDGKVIYSVSDPYRLPSIVFFTVLFLILTIIFGGIQGVRGLLSLFFSFVIIVYILLPGILNGYSPVLVSLLASSIIIVLGSYITHGFNKTTTSAVFGMIITVLITGILSFFAIKWGHLTGYSSEEVVYLNFDTRGGVNLVGLLFGGILIGLLGILYDVAIGQAISVEELHTIAPHTSKWAIYNRAVRIGREHIGALVNTLAIAYVGVSLPLLLLIVNSSSDSLLLTLNREVFATEVIRTLIGSIGIILAVPVTTWISVSMLIKKNKNDVSKDILEKEGDLINSLSKERGHSH
jgi:uncharacterized membrane protein